MAVKAPEVVPAIWTKHIEKANRPRVAVLADCGEESRTHQSFRDECDINQVMARHRLTGTVRQHQEPPDYSDYTNLGDYQDALNVIATAKSMFENLPFEIRKRFNYTPQELVDFTNDPNNMDEAIRLGIATATQEIPTVDAAIPVSDGDISGGE